MIIDFHAHAFPDAIAEKTIAYLAGQGGIKPFSDGTARGLVRSIKEAGVDAAVVLPVVTKPSQFNSVNAFAEMINNGKFDEDGAKLFSFGGIHPDSENLVEEIEKIKGLGLKGIKLHPDYQKTFIDDKKYLVLIEKAVEAGLTVSIHAGLDVGYPDPIHCTPTRAKSMLRSIGGGNIILAHMGGFAMWEEVLDTLCGENVYFDTGVVARHLSIDLASEMIHAHGADKVLYATDSPWEDQKISVDFVKSLKITSEEKEKILGQNAARLLKIGD